MQIPRVFRNLNTGARVFWSSLLTTKQTSRAKQWRNCDHQASIRKSPMPRPRLTTGPTRASASVLSPRHTNLGSKEEDCSSKSSDSRADLHKSHRWVYAHSLKYAPV